jgi:hypothetical protein
MKRPCPDRSPGHQGDARRHHITTFVPDVDMPVFTGDKGAPLSRSNWRRAVNWPEAIESVGLPDGFRFHDLRHTSNNLAAAAGAPARSDRWPDRRCPLVTTRDAGYWPMAGPSTLPPAERVTSPNTLLACLVSN